jgi:ribosome modulation factor
MERNPTSGGVIFADGYRAGRMGSAHTANPYAKHTTEATAWCDGWNEGSTRRAWIEVNNIIDGRPGDGG